jgi:RNA polymerase sigma-70 factor (ECF subfamily)
MGRQGEAYTKRLRRLARALVDDSDSADALVLEALTAAEERSLDLNGLFAILIARRRVRADAPARRRQRLPGSQSDIVRAFEALPLQDREVIALAVVEQLPYEDAARVLDLGTDAFIARLTQARAAFGRIADGERHVVLRLVK